MGMQNERFTIIRIVLCAAVVYNVAVWVDLVSMLNYWGFHNTSTPIQLGVLVMSFSGSMALASVLGNGLHHKYYELVMIIAAMTSGIIMVFQLLNQSFTIAILLIILKGGLIGLFINGQTGIWKQMGDPIQYAAVDSQFERLAAIIKFAGPLAAGVCVMIWPPQAALWLAAAVYTAAAAPVVYLLIRYGSARHSHLLQVKEDDGKQLDVEQPAAAPADWDARIYLILGLIILASMSFFVTVGDSQLVVLFRDIFAWNDASMVAFVMAAAGLGTLLVRTGLESPDTKTPFKALTFSSLGLSAVFLIVTWCMHLQVNVLWFLVLFFAGGVCWQIGFSLYLNKLMRNEPAGKMTIIFGAVMAITYILGPLFGGYGVAWIGVVNTYYISGLCMLGFGLICSVVYLLIHFKRTKGQSASHSLSSEN
ncbi:MFS transporter [Paenibacillus sp. UMB4589-SE434]|uniref:MFS transporter n=1 Tax=Paenibacillus sp. UMB4589-SE434 TaxID=3046314 RepID=UPI00254D3BBB|nr:MFS transporter [Paenibacillus sp. UMB4589-SE434]MDK8182709.1 MFS transporter [Paenibacillus sp. UMB4589-SE434]